jgi:G:T-mismatch repair DNA endonuclease (very short patch repair protein)
VPQVGRGLSAAGFSRVMGVVGRDTPLHVSNRSRDTAQNGRYDGSCTRPDFATVSTPPLSGRRRADVVFTRRRTAVFIESCFWHGCPEHFTFPKVSTGYWLPKRERNMERCLAPA